MIRTSPPVTYTTTPPISKRTAFLKAAKLHPHPPLLVVFKAAPSSRSLVMLNGLLTRYQGSSRGKSKHTFKFPQHARYLVVAGSRYQRPPQQSSSQAPAPPGPPAKHQHQQTLVADADGGCGCCFWLWWWWWASTVCVAVAVCCNVSLENKQSGTRYQRSTILTTTTS